MAHDRPFLHSLGIVFSQNPANWVCLPIIHIFKARKKHGKSNKVENVFVCSSQLGELHVDAMQCRCTAMYSIPGISYFISDCMSDLMTLIKRVWCDVVEPPQPQKLRS